MRNQWGRSRRANCLLGVAVVMTIAAGCSGDDSGGDDAASDTTAAAEETTTSVADTTTTTALTFAAGEAECAESTPDCAGTISPAEGLADGDEVTIEASGFDANLDLGITQCADESDPDVGPDVVGAGEGCNLRAIGTVSSDADGNVSGTYVVTAGQTMIDNTEAGITCDAEHDCVVSVGELIPDADAQRVTFHVRFA